MKNSLLLALTLSSAASLIACNKAEDAKGTEGAAAPKPADTKPAAAAPPPAAAGKEVDLSAWGPAFAGFVAMAPDGAKVTFDDPSRQLSISDTDYLSVSEAEFWADGVKSLSTDADNSEIKNVGDNEVRWLRNPPLGKQWNFDVKVDIGGKAHSCSGATFTDAPTADALVAICKSIKKK